MEASEISKKIEASLSGVVGVAMMEYFVRWNCVSLRDFILPD